MNYRGFTLAHKENKSAVHAEPGVLKLDIWLAMLQPPWCHDEQGHENHDQFPC